MKAGAVLAMLSIAMLAAGGCDTERREAALEGQSPSSGGTLGSGAPLGEPLEVMSGELGQVDLQARTFTIKTADADVVFAFTDATQVDGAAGPQGLAGREGARVSLRYRQRPDGKIAERITIN
jgi:hypothetical protein